MQASKCQALWTRPYVLTILGMLFVFVPYSLYLPVMPLYMLEELGQSAQVAGLSNALFLLASVLCRTQTAGLEGRFGRRKVLLGSSLLFLLSHLLFLATVRAEWVLGARFLSGACFAVANTAIMSLGSRLVPASRKGEGIAYLTTVVTAGSALGPFVGLQLAQQFGFSWVFVFCALSTLLGCCFLLPIREQAAAPAQPWPQSPRALLEWRAVPVCTVTLLASVAYAGVLTFAAVYAKELGLGQLVDWFFVVLALCAVVVRLFTGRLMDLHGPNVVLYPCFGLFACGLVVLSLAKTAAVLLAAAVLIGAAYGILVPSVQTVAVERAVPERTSVVTATYFTFLDLGLAAGAYLLGTWAPFVGFGRLYLLLSLLVVATLGLYVLIHGRKAGAGRSLEAAEQEPA